MEKAPDTWQFSWVSGAFLFNNALDGQQVIPLRWQVLRGSSLRFLRKAPDCLSGGS